MYQIEEMYKEEVKIWRQKSDTRAELLIKAYTLLLQVDQIGVQGKEIDKLITEIKLELGL